LFHTLTETNTHIRERELSLFCHVHKTYFLGLDCCHWNVTPFICIWSDNNMSDVIWGSFGFHIVISWFLVKIWNYQCFVILYCHCGCFLFCFVVRGESPGCHLISTASMLEWLRNPLPNHSQGSCKYGKIEPKYPEGGHLWVLLDDLFYIRL